LGTLDPYGLRDRKQDAQPLPVFGHAQHVAISWTTGQTKLGFQSHTIAAF